ncbi:MAG: sporulation protein [Bacteroidia bacterium]|nr:sporulation protein [Bacteroidia bacterium]MBT8268939.1 sporulation protein [Bacteroidia bacterium]NNF82987.1 sporulation protein [Flavobacteriaceae bacterium]NNK70640.1 sporulation protein [Flavobacteriaceae bacterium]NNL80462.1 sporulation protein [Flavobacteriaceae bacterium]
MNLHFEELLKQITDFIKSEAKTDTVVGEQFVLGEFKCVPVIKVGMGFGSGGGEGIEPKSVKREGVGAGAGIGIEPIGFLVTRGDEITFLEAGKAHGLSAAFEKMPDMIEKIYSKREKEEMTS